MKLDIKDRLILANQFKILEKLYPDDAQHYEQHRRALENGYTLNYPWMVEWFSDEMTEEECREVLDILDMYRAITFSYKKIEDKEGIEDNWLRFKGFDGNNESNHYGYAQYFILDLGRFQELKYDSEYPSLNSHGEVLPKYRKMLAYWYSNEKKYELSKAQLIGLLSA